MESSASFLRFVDDSHAPAANPAQDPVVVDQLADQRVDAGVLLPGLLDARLTSRVIRGKGGRHLAAPARSAARPGPQAAMASPYTRSKQP